MNENVIFLITLSSLLLGLWAELSHRHGLAWFCNVAAGIGYGSWALVLFWEGDSVFGSFCAAFAGWHIYLAWRNRPRNRRLPGKVAGAVRNLGHRLVVVNPAPSGGKS